MRFGRAEKEKTDALHVERLRVVEAWPTGRMCQNVVGESHYEVNLKQIAGRLGGGPTGEAITTAVVMAQPTNEYDPNAVAVLIDGAIVGHLPREDAADYSPLLQMLAERQVALSVPARVWWGAWDDERWAASVQLDLGPPGLLVPVNAPPSDNAMQIPPGAAMQVTGEDAHMDALAPLVAATGHAAVLATLHEVTEQKARSTRQVLEVRIDGRPVGRLTPGMSEHLLAVVRHAEQSGITLYVRGSVRGNPFKAEVTLYPTRAADLPPAWVENLSSRATVAERSSPQSNRKSKVVTQPVALPPAGWFPNPTGPGWRWWDGTTWTEHTHDQ